jgi:hypothetical protein
LKYTNRLQSVYSDKRREILKSDHDRIWFALPAEPAKNHHPKWASIREAEQFMMEFCPGWNFLKRGTHVLYHADTNDPVERPTGIPIVLQLKVHRKALAQNPARLHLLL